MIKNSILQFWDQIRGIKYGPKIKKDLDLNQFTTKQEIESIISSLDHRIVLSFYDAFYKLKTSEQPITRGDNGAFTDVKKDKNKLKIKRGNHGWHEKKWTPIPEVELVNIIYESREFNNGKMRMESRIARMFWVKKGKEKLLITYYHSI